MPVPDLSFEIRVQSFPEVQGPGVVVYPVFQAPDAQDEKNKENDASAPRFDLHGTGLAWLDERLAGWLDRVLFEEGFTGAKGKTLVLRLPETAPFGTLVLTGLGKLARFNPGRLESAILKGVGAVAAWKGLASLTLMYPKTAFDAVKHFSPQQALLAMVDGAAQAVYCSEEAAKPPSTLKHITLVWGQDPYINLGDELPTAWAMAQARARAKDLVNKPSNLKTVKTLADEARALSGLPGVQVRIEEDTAWIAREMPCFYEVAKGSVATDPPKFITVSYQPADPTKVKRRLALVGKSVIFDTGGYQVKPGDYMNTMKGDMTGGAMVLQVVRALAQLQPQHVALTVYLAVTPNKIDSDAMLPDAIVQTTCGKKVEIRHTDAEGRLTLIDAVAKAADAPQTPDALVTIATLTGSAMRAVGLCVALMANDAARAAGEDQKLLAAAHSLGEPFQALDLIEEDEDDIKSKLDGADIINTSQNKNRGAQSAAAFVMSGAPARLPMLHLDIAGADMTSDEKATGIGLKSLIRYVLASPNGT
jgi:leucyl aminopeptidase